MAAELPRGTVTILFSDIEGSTLLLKRLGETYGQVLADHQTLLRGGFERTGGLEIDTQGDAFFVVFSRAKDAVAAALEGQRALREFSWPENVEVKVRMGMHTGEPSVTAERYIGLGVHRAARICAAAHGGQILLSQSSYAVLVDDVLPDIEFRDLGEHRLKDLDRPERIFQLSVPDLQSSFPPLNSLGTVEPFAGRERELEEIVVATARRELIGVVVPTTQHSCAKGSAGSWRRRGSRSSAALPTPSSSSLSWPRVAPPSRSPTSVCRRPTPTKGCLRPS